MKRDSALGFIETVGLASSIVAADAALKSANVKLIGREISKGQGWVTVKITGDVAAVQAAVSAAKTALAATAAADTAVAHTDVIPRPAAGLSIVMIRNEETILNQGKTDEKALVEEKALLIEESASLNEESTSLIEESDSINKESTPAEETEENAPPDEQPETDSAPEESVDSAPKQEPPPQRNAGNKHGKRRK